MSSTCADRKHERASAADRLVCLRTDYVNRIQQAVEDRVWAIEDCNGIGHHITMRLLAAGEQVVDVPPKLSARARIFATAQGSQGRRHRRLGRQLSPGLRPVVGDEQRRERLLQPVRLLRGSGRAAVRPGTSDIKSSPFCTGSPETRRAHPQRVLLGTRMPGPELIA